MLTLNGSLKSLVHREGFEPSYLLRGADLQSAGFNHSPTCAETPITRLLLDPASFFQSFARVATGARGLSCSKTKLNKEEKGAKSHAQKSPLEKLP
jgi:hypothetical protein